jgi:hypothetical protein
LRFLVTEITEKEVPRRFDGRIQNKEDFLAFKVTEKKFANSISGRLGNKYFEVAIFFGRKMHGRA